MKDIADLQKTVETARAAYARASEQQARSRKDAMELIHVVENQLRENRVELSQNDVQRERITWEYGQLRRMLHALVMDVEVGAAEAPQVGAAAIEARPNGVTAPAPVPAPSEPQEPVAEASNGVKPPPRKRAKAEAAKREEEAGSDEIRAGFKRMLKKVRPRNTAHTEDRADTPAAAAAAE